MAPRFPCTVCMRGVRSNSKALACDACGHWCHVKCGIQITPEDYEAVRDGRPVIIEGGTDEWPARQWTLDSLCEKLKDRDVYVRANTNCEDYKMGRKYNIRQSTFDKYIKDLKAENKTAKKSYLAVQNLKKAFPEIQSDVTVPEYVGKVHGGPYLWIAIRGHYEYCHIDADDGFLIMMQGRKQVRLFGCDLAPLYPNPLGSKGRTIQSEVDCDNPDLKKHPLFENVECHHCLLQPGEMLYIPAFWWHQVTSVDTAISINIFWGDAGQNTYLTKVMESSRWPAFSHWLLNIIEQNRSYASFNRILSRLPEAIYHFIKNQWHEETSDSQLQLLVNHVMRYLDIDTLPSEKGSGKNPTTLQIRGLMWRS